MHAPALPTCHDHVYDFFVVRKALSPAVVGVQRFDDAGLHPQHPSRLLIQSKALKYKVRQLDKAPKVPGYMPAGPCGAPLLRSCFRFG